MPRSTAPLAPRPARRSLAGAALAALAASVLGACEEPVPATPTPAAEATPTPAAPTPPEELSLRLTLASGPFTAGRAYPWSAAVTSSWDGDVTEAASIRLRVAPSAQVTVGAEELSFEKVGAYTLTVDASYHGQVLSEVVSRDVVAGAPVAVAVTLSTLAPRAGTQVEVSGDLIDAFGNVAFEDPQLTLAIEPTEGLDIQGQSFVGTVAGAYLLTALNPATGVSGGAAFEVVPGKSVSMDIALSDDRILPGEVVNVVTTTSDAYGNATESQPEIATSPSDGVRIAGPRVTFGEEGTFTVLASWAAEDRDLSASAGPVTVDGTAPTLTVSSPRRAGWTTTPTVSMRGQVSDEIAGVDEVLYGGAWIPIAPDGTFTAPIHSTPGLNVLEIEAVDFNGNRREIVQTYLYAPSYAPLDQRVDDAFYGRMGQETIDELAELLEDELDQEEIEAWAKSYNPIEAYYDVYTGPLGNDVVTSAYINILELRYSEAIVTLIPHADTGSGYLDLGVVFDDLGVTLEAYGELANVDYELCGELDTAEGVAIGRARATIDEAGRSHVELTGVAVELEGFDMEMCDDSLDYLMDAIEEDMQAELEEILVDLLYDEIPGELEVMLDSLTLHETFELEGEEMVLDAALEGLTFDDLGATLWMWSRLGADPIDGLPENPGVPLTTGAPPSYGADFTLYTSANDDLLNQLLYTLWYAGTLHLEYTAEELGLTEEQVGLLFNGASEVVFKLEPALPPVLSASGSDGYLMDAGLGDCYIDVWSDATTGDPEDLRRDYRLAATLIAPADADAPTPSILRITFGEPTTLHVHILESSGGATLTEETLNLVLDAAADELIAALNGSLGEIPIPTIEGYVLLAYELYMDGPEDDFLTIAGDLVPPP